MNSFDYEADAHRAMKVILDGGISIIPTTVGYVILAADTNAINKIIFSKQRGPTKLNAMIGNKSLHAALHNLPSLSRRAVRMITEEYDLPMGTVGPANLNHPMLQNLDKTVLERTTLDGNIAMLMNAGSLLDIMGQLSFEANIPVIGSSANLSLKGTKFRVEDIESEVRDAADLIIDYGLMRWSNYGKSSTMINVLDFSVVRYGSCFDLISDLLTRHFKITLTPETDHL